MTLPEFSIFSRSEASTIVQWRRPDGLRCHVWLNDGALGDTLYTNPKTTEFRGDGWFRTRRASLGSKQNHKLRDALIEFATPQRIEEALAAWKKAEADAKLEAEAKNIAKLRAAVVRRFPELGRTMSDEDLLGMERAICEARQA
jgi:hypothetical protein